MKDKNAVVVKYIHLIITIFLKVYTVITCQPRNVYGNTNPASQIRLLHFNYKKKSLSSLTGQQTIIIIMFTSRLVYSRIK